MARYFVETEHIRGEPRIYWVAEKVSSQHYRSKAWPVTDYTTSKRKAAKDCDRLNKADSAVPNGERK